MNNLDIHTLNQSATLPFNFHLHNRNRFLDLVRQNLKIDLDGFILLSGPKLLLKNDDDTIANVIHEPFFFYLFGVKHEVNMHALIHIKNGYTVLFTLLSDPSDSFLVKPISLLDLKTKYQVNEVFELRAFEDYLNLLDPEHKSTIYLNSGISPANHKPIETSENTFKDLIGRRSFEYDIIYPISREVRVFKSKDEVDVMRSAIKRASFAHIQVMKIVCEGITEKQVSDYFSSIRIALNSDLPYPNIVCAGQNASFLHYQPSSNVMLKNGQLVLIDCAARFQCYNSDITRTFPVNGKFSDHQKRIYNIVLNAQQLAAQFTKPNISWLESHNAAIKFITQELIAIGIIQTSLNNALKLGLGNIFMPHSIGHYIGLYTHDLPGFEFNYNRAYSDPKISLGINREFKKGMVVTIEPGIYFNDFLLNQSYLNPDVRAALNHRLITEYKNEIGGIRIEDMYLITNNGNENLSKDLIKTVEDIEELMKN